MKQLHVFTNIEVARWFFDGQFRFLSQNGEEIRVVSNSEEDRDFSERNDLKYTQIPILRKVSPFSDLKSIFLIYKLIRREKFDVVVGHTPKGAMVSMLASFFAGVRNRVYYRHGLVYTTAKGFKRFILKSVEKLTARVATRIVNVSPSLNKLAITDNLNPESKQTLIGAGTCGGIDTQGIFNPELINAEKLNRWREKFGLKGDEYTVGFCGRLSNDKGIKELVAGFKRFKKSHPEINSRLLLVGPMDSRDTLPSGTIAEIESNRDIIATGEMAKKELPYMYTLMDVFVLPSYREGFGMSVIEASAMERPILVSRSHGCVDSIIEGITGEYIEIDPESISSGLTRMQDSELRKNYGVGGRKWVMENFDQSVLWPKVLEFFRVEGARE